MFAIDELKEGFNIMLHPTQATKKERGIKDSLKFYYKLSIVPWLLYILFGAIFIASSVGIAVAVILSIIIAILVFWVLMPISFFISALIYHAFGKLFRVFKSGYANTFNATVYGTIPSILFMWLGAVALLSTLSLVFAIWSLVVLIIALANRQNTTMLRAFLVILIPLIIIVIITVFFAFGLFLPSTSSSGLISSSCIASTGYYCSNLIYNASTNTIHFGLGQASANNFESWAIAYAPSNASISTATGIPEVEFIKVSNNPFNAGEIINASLPASSLHSVKAGTFAAGNIWICYSLNSTITPGIGSCTASSGNIEYAQVAALTATAK